MNTTTETEYLKDIKFRNAVKKATRFRVSGKNKTDRGSFVIRDFRSDDNNHRFTISYYYGGFGGDRAEVHNLQRELEFQRDLFMAGFEGEYVEEYVRGEIEKVFVWKKAA